MTFLPERRPIVGEVLLGPNFDYTFGPTDLPALTQLFRAYAASLPIDLGYQGFDAELASLPGKSPRPPARCTANHSPSTPGRGSVDAMRTILLATPVLLAAACSPAPPPTPQPEPSAQTQDAVPAGEPLSTGLMGGISTTAAGDVAGLTVGADRLAFTNAEGEETFAAPTEFLGVVDPSTLIAEGGDSFSAAAPSSTATRVELRRIASAAPEALCGGMAATHVALVSAEPLTGLQLMVFTGADGPGPSARDSAVCAIFAYAVD